MTDFGMVGRLVAGVLGDSRAEHILSMLAIDPALGAEGEGPVRAQIAMALNALLLSDLLDHVPTAAAYVESLREEGGVLSFDHGALRTVDGDTGALPRGYAAFARILEPLGYRVAGLYPLPRLHMTGRAFAQLDHPESVPQFFVSELHMAELPEDAQAAGQRVFGRSHDPLGEAAVAALDHVAREGRCSFAMALDLLHGAAGAFGPQHPAPALADYEILRAHSSEAAWMATEGNAFNHATHRVADVERLAEDLRGRGLPMKAAVEVSANGGVRQTAFIADRVIRRFRLEDGSLTEREVPGSFFEFISRDVDPVTGRIDLSFDSGNATGIFAVTSGS